MLQAARPDVVLVDTMTYGRAPLRVEDVRAAAPRAVGAADGSIGKRSGEAELIAAIRAATG
jgi:hypothetical protein